MNVQALKEILTTLALKYPFQTETDKNEFLAQIDSLDAPEGATPVETPSPVALVEPPSVETPSVEVPVNPDMTPPAGTANEAPAEGGTVIPPVTDTQAQ